MIDIDLVEGNKDYAIWECMKLRQAIRYHRDQKGYSRCFLDDLKLYELLPEWEEDKPYKN